ncbi:MAG: F0F1 ATP synthase subunit A [Atribacterota bacterium]|jgi:F-type H+-transporting ATPase subunit a|nr:F0F1 ATP synthase subunit A [Atribacterota bacterium]MDY0382707.1 F0F1 ATP synthase subunit A [Atribacterota bacterium]
MEITPDNIIYWQWEGFHLNATIISTWLVMLVLLLISWLATRNLVMRPKISRWQVSLEVVIGFIREQIKEITQQNPDPFIPFLGSLFLFISVSNLLDIIPGFRPPTGSLSTTTALAVCVFFAIPIFGIARAGFKNYFKQYLEPSVLMLPFNIIGEFSRTLALAVRLFGNIMSGSLIAGILLIIAPLFLPIIMQVFGLLIGQIQAYIFTILATVYIGSAAQAENELKMKKEKEGSENNE